MRRLIGLGSASKPIVGFRLELAGMAVLGPCDRLAVAFATVAPATASSTAAAAALAIAIAIRVAAGLGRVGGLGNGIAGLGFGLVGALVISNRSDRMFGRRLLRRLRTLIAPFAAASPAATPPLAAVAVLAFRPFLGLSRFGLAFALGGLVVPGLVVLGLVVGRLVVRGAGFFLRLGLVESTSSSSSASTTGAGACSASARACSRLCTCSPFSIVNDTWPPMVAIGIDQ